VCNYRGRGLVVGVAQRYVPFATDKNSENRGEYDDLMDVIVERS
jgi:hypothetical protein